MGSWCVLKLVAGKVEKHGDCEMVTHIGALHPNSNNKRYLDRDESE